MKAGKSKLEKMEEKREAVPGTGRKKNLAVYFASACAAMIAGFGLIYVTGIDRSTTVATTQDPYRKSSTTLSYPINLFEDGKARHFQFKDGTRTIKFFVLKSSDGIIRAAFDACDVCWPAAKGYYQNGDEMVCRNCGQRFASVLVNEVRGGCNPAPLKRAVVGDQLIITVKDIFEGRQYFDFTRGS